MLRGQSVTRAAVILAVGLAALGARTAADGQLIGPGQAPSVAIAPDGVGYIAYNGPHGALMICAVSPGHSGCAPHNAIAPDGGNPEAEPPLVAAGRGGVVDLVADRATDTGTDYYDDEELVSTDGGASFTGAGPLSAALYFDGAFGPDGEVLFDQAEQGLSAEVGSLAGPDDAGANELTSTDLVDAVGGWASATPVVVAGDGPTYAYHGLVPTSFDAPSRWARRRIPAGNAFALASDGRGLYLLEGIGVLQAARLTLARWNGATFGRAQRLPSRTEVGAVGALALAENGHGRLLAVWYAEPSDRIEAAVEYDHGRRWTRARTLATHVATVSRLKVAVDARGAGLVVWDRNAGFEVSARAVSIASLLRTARR